jgi:hypothetical protein
MEAARKQQRELDEQQLALLEIESATSSVPSPPPQTSSRVTEPRQDHGASTDRSNQQAEVESNSAAISDALRDWSSTGRGSHVDFHPDEVVPLQQGALLSPAFTAFT